MFMLRNMLCAFVALGTYASAAAQAETPSSESPRTVATLPDTVGSADEPLPPSPKDWNPTDKSITPSVDKNFGIGIPATDEVIAAIDIDIMPDGTGLPAGSGTFEQGKELYSDLCAACHGENLEGIKETGAPALIGGRGSLATDAPVKTVESYWPYASTLFDYVHRAMPLTDPGSLKPDQLYAISAYILGQADIWPKDKTLDAEAFKTIKMPNEDGFIKDPRPEGL